MSEERLVRPVISKRPGVGKYLVFGIIAVVILTVVGGLSRAFKGEGAPSAGSSDYALGYAIGQASASGLMAAFVVWLVIYFAFVRQRDPGVGSSHFAILALIGVGVSLAFGFFAPSAVSGLPLPQSRNVAVAELQQKADAESASLRAQLNAVEFDKILDASSLAKKGGVARSRQRLARSREIWRAHFNWIEARHDETVAVINRVEPTQSRRAAALGEFEKNWNAGAAARSASRANLDQMLDEMDAVLVVLEQHPRDWAVDGGAVMFTSAATHKAFLAHHAEFLKAQGRLRANKEPG